MAIKSRAELEHSAIQQEERAYETRAFNQAMKSIPNMSSTQYNLFLSDSDLKDSYFADLQDEDKQQLFSEKLGTDMLKVFSTNKNLHMLRNEAIHTLKTQGVSIPKGSASIGVPLDVTNRKAFSVTGERHEALDVEAQSLNKVAKLDALEEALENRRVKTDEFGVRSHSIGDKRNKTLYFGGPSDIFDVDAASNFTLDDVEMGCATQGILYEQAIRFDDPRRALELSTEPMDGKALAKKGLNTRRYTTEADVEKWDSIRENVMHKVLTAKYEQDEQAKEALVQSEGYRLAYLSANPLQGIGRSMKDVQVAQDLAARNDETLVVKEVNPETNNMLGRITEQVRREIITPEVVVEPSQNPYGNVSYDDREVSYGSAPPIPEEFSGAEVHSSNPFGAPSSNDDLRSMSFLDDDPNHSYSQNVYGNEPEAVPEESSNSYQYEQMDLPLDDTPIVEQPLEQSRPSEPVVSEPLEMSVHASDELSVDGASRAYEAVRLFGQEAKESNREAVVYVSPDANVRLKKAVFANKDVVRMEPLDKDHVPKRSLIVQHGRTIEPSFKEELLFATSKSDERDVRALLPDPNEKDLYALNEYLVMESTKVDVQYQNDGIGQDMTKSVESQPAKSNPFRSHSADDAEKKAALKMSQEHNQKAQADARRNTERSNEEVRKGQYQHNPF